MSSRNLLALSVIASVAISFAACSKTSSKEGSSAPAKVASEGHNHEGWWCAEHGVPEELCAQCNTKLAADFKAKGDWCEKHNRPESQCFICHPEKEVEFAALYEAKFGKKPPKPEADDAEHEKGTAPKT